jgi:hypothetical protein
MPGALSASTDALFSVSGDYFASPVNSPSSTAEEMSVAEPAENKNGDLQNVPFFLHEIWKLKI